MMRIVFCLILFIHLPIADAMGASILGLRQGVHPDKTRLVVDLDDEIKYKSAPSVGQTDFDIILYKSKPLKQLETKQKGHGLVSYCHLNYDGISTTLRVKTKTPSMVKKVFILPKSGKNKARLVIDFAKATVKRQATPKHFIPLPAMLPAEKIKTLLPMPYIKPAFKNIVIDAGHGGHDPGTVSKAGHFEKDVTLAVALALKKSLSKNPHYRVHLTRSTDTFLPLRDRFAVARKVDADLLISLHADSNPDKRLKGLAIYTLSKNATDKEAERLAKKENAADFLEDLSYTKNTGQDVSEILIDLSLTKTMSSSKDFANTLVKNMNSAGLTSKNTYRSADFAVLKAPDVTSVLIELGYLSNKTDEKRLVDKAYQRKLANKIANAINDYFEHIKS